MDLINTRKENLKKKRAELLERTRSLYATGLTLRKVGELVNKSHQWVANVVKGDEV